MLGGGALVVALGELIADALAVGVGGGAVIAAELLKLSHQSADGGVGLGDGLAEPRGPGVGERVLCGLGGGDLGGVGGGPVAVEQRAEDAVNRVVDGGVTECGADVPAWCGCGMTRVVGLWEQT